MKYNYLKKWKSNGLSLLLLISIGLFISLALTSFKTEKISPNEVPDGVRQQFRQDVSVLEQQCRILTQTITASDKKEISAAPVQEVFYRVKRAYKQVEYLLEYLDPEIAKNLNGAPLPKVLIEEVNYQTLSYQSPSFRTFPPQGLQVLEELLFADTISPEAIKEAIVLAYALEEKVSLFQNSFHNQPLTHKQVLESLREELIRVMSLGISGFDAPAAGNEIEHTALALQPVLATAQLYEKTSRGEALDYSRKAVQQLKVAIFYLQQHPGFDTLDRLFFIRELADPAYATLTRLQQILVPAGESLSIPVNDKASSLFSPDFLQAAYFAKQDRSA